MERQINFFNRVIAKSSSDSRIQSPDRECKHIMKIAFRRARLACYVNEDALVAKNRSNSAYQGNQVAHLSHEVRMNEIG